MVARSGRASRSGAPRRPKRLVIGTTVKEQLSTSFFAHLPALIAAGWDVHLVTSPGPWPAGAPPVPVTVHEIPMPKTITPIADVRALGRWVALLRRLRPQAVIGGSPKGALLAMLAAAATGVPTRIYLHRGARWETLEGRSRRLTMRADQVTAKAATQVVAVSPSLAQQVRRAGVSTQLPIVLAEGGSKGVDLERYKPRDTDSFATPPDPDVVAPRLGFVGRLTRDKGMDTVLAAFQGVREHYRQAELWVIGEVDDADPPPRMVLERLADEPGIRLLGWRTDLPELLPELDVLLFPSAREGLPNAVIEAAACGVPTVGWDVTGVTDAINDPSTGRLVEFGDVDGFTAAVLDVVALPRGSFRRACRKWAARFDRRRLTAAWLRLLGEVDPDSAVTSTTEGQLTSAGVAAQVSAPINSGSGADAQTGPTSSDAATHSDLGIVIVAFRSLDTIGSCLESIAEHAAGASVVVVDNSGEAQQIDALATGTGLANRLGELRVIDAGSNLGYAAGVNLGFSQLPSSCRYLLICNPDVELLADPMLVVAGLDQADVTAGRLLGELPNASKATTYGSELLRAVAGVRFRYLRVPDGADTYVPQVAGAYLLQTCDYYRAHPLDEYFDLYYEDVAYCDEAREQGRGVLLQSPVVGRHVGGASSGRSSKVPYVAARVSRLRYLRRRYPQLPDPLLLAPLGVERCVRALTRQPEGAEARRAAWRAVRQETTARGSVRPLAEPTTEQSPWSQESGSTPISEPRTAG